MLASASLHLMKVVPRVAIVMIFITTSTTPGSNAGRGGEMVLTPPWSGWAGIGGC